MNTLTLDGKTYPCRVTMGAFVRFKRETGRDASQLDATDTADNLLFLHCCLLSACNADKVECNIDFLTFADLLAPSDMQNFYADMASTATDSEKKRDPKNRDTRNGDTRNLDNRPTARHCTWSHGHGALRFEGCTPTEFHAAHTAWTQHQQQQQRTSWEQTRILALCTLQPHSTQSLTPTEVLPLPWDKEQLPSEPQLSPQERKARYEAALERYGMSDNV